MKLLAFAASLRKESVNKRLLSKAVEIAGRHGAEIDHADFREFDMPHYDFDLQQAEGIPPGAQELGRRISEADGIMIASPEYNHSIPGTLKNAIDWLSRIDPVPLNGACVMLMSASPGHGRRLSRPDAGPHSAGHPRCLGQPEHVCPRAGAERLR